MDEFVKQFLLSNKQISFGKLGALKIVPMQNEVNVGNLSDYQVIYDAGNSQPSQKQLNWFQNSAQHIHETFDSYCNTLLYTLQTEGIVCIDGIGTFEKSNDQIVFNSSLNLQNPFTTVDVKKIRKIEVEQANPTVSAALENTDNGFQQLEEAPASNAKYLWWVLVILIIAITVYLFMNGFSLSSLSNQNTIGSVLYIQNLI
ncbi:MAG: hypothetical protein E6Q95_00020 [Chitinophagaceae bacterium]|nr:MAG: hypothetical protein E6Q95_00020 [Chitinophagaceae bacterium]